MNLYQTYKADEALEKQGIDLRFGPDTVITIARAGGSNSRYSRQLGEKMRPYRRQVANGTLDDDTAKQIMAEVYADTIVIGWSGVTDETGAAMKFTRENCIKLLLDLPELFAEIQEQAGRVANFRAEELAEDAKN